MFKNLKLNCEVELIRTNRKKTISMQIVNSFLVQKLRVLAPKNTSVFEIKKLLRKKKNWLEKKMVFQASLKSRLITRKTKLDGHILYYLNQAKILKIIPNQTNNMVQLQGNFINIYLTQTHKQYKTVTELLLKWYLENAQKLLIKRTEYFSNLIELNAPSIGVKSYRSKWGSCSLKGGVRYNYKIIQAPIEVIDYLVVHEICHLKEPNHSKDFWRLVERFYPDYINQKKWLKNNGAELVSFEFFK